VNISKKLDSGLLLPVMEEFYSIQGEGFHTGKAAYFIRIGGCDVGCEWCDVKEAWNADDFPPKDVDDIVKRIIQKKYKSVLFTGGEPLAFNLDYICGKLKKENITLFLETSGSENLSGEWDWICLSPKKRQPPGKEIFQKADEMKIIVSGEDDLVWAEENAALVNNNCMLFLQPEWSKRNEMTPVVVEYILNNPKWRMSLQTHKYLRIP
jgi:organic radical activating enzyme